VIYGNNEQALAHPAGIHWICPATETNHIPTICLSQFSKSIGIYGRGFPLTSGYVG